MKKRFFIILVSGLLLLLISFFGYDFYMKKQIDQGIGEYLKDPTSIIFSDLEYNQNGACGYYNAKNSYGAYGGKTFFYGEFLSGKFFKLNEGIKDDFLMTKCEDINLIVR